MIIKEITSGISHIEDLPLTEFIKVVNTLHEYELTEKLDGAQILFGIDDKGFYTSRETKGGYRIYSESEYGLGFAETYMRSAHKLLEQSLPALRAAGLRPGDQVEAEVLYGELPNVVPYSADTNYLIFLRRTEGQVNIDRLKENLCGQSLSITLMSPFTDDGRTIHLREETNSWQFSRAPKIPVDIPNVQKAVTKPMNVLISYLKKPSGISNLSNLVIEGLPLNKRPDFCAPEDWKVVKEQVREKREEIRKEVQEKYIPAIKDILLERLVHSQHSQFGPLLEDGGWIEGVVARHKTTGKMVKIVDKNHFGVIREFAWSERNKLTERAKTSSGDLSFMGNLHVKMATAIGHPELGTIQAKNYLRKVGTITEERLNTLSTDIDFESIRDYWLSLLEHQEIQLGKELDKYEKEKEVNEASADILLKTAVKKRTLETYAATFQQIMLLKEATLQARTTYDLLRILVGKQLDNLT